LFLVSQPIANAFNVQVYDLMHRPGEMRESQLDAPASESFGNAVIGVQAGTNVHLETRLESLHDGILVSAEVETIADGECVRCLIDVALPIRVDIAELFAYSFDEAFDYTVVDDHIDLEPLVRDAVVLSLPFQPVCRPDCPGLDPATGERLADFPDRKPAEIVDPRWSALAGFTESKPADTDVEGAAD
jgi:uncharacterized protein